MFSNTNEEILELEIVCQKCSTASLNIENKTKKIEYDKGDIYIQNKEIKKAIIIIDDGTIIIVSGMITDKDIVQLAKQLYS